MPAHSLDWDKMLPIVEEAIAGGNVNALALKHSVSENTIRKYRTMYLAGKHSTGSPPINPAIREHLHQSTNPRPVISSNATVLAVPDMHHPFAHPDALAFLLEVRRTKRTTLSLCLGDEIDAASFSRYIPDPDGMAPGKELAAAIDSLVPFYREFPEMLVCESNHTVRPWKKAFEAGLPAAFLPTYAKLLNAPDGWRWANHWIIDGVRYFHGDAGRSGQGAPIQYMKLFKSSIVIGHLHANACVQYEGPAFAVNAGCLIDESAYCFKYAKNSPVPPSLGCAVIHSGRWAEFVPMLLDGHGRWIGRL